MGGIGTSAKSTPLPPLPICTERLIELALERSCDCVWLRLIISKSVAAFEEERLLLAPPGGLAKGMRGDGNGLGAWMLALGNGGGTS